MTSTPQTVLSSTEPSYNQTRLTFSPMAILSRSVSTLPSLSTSFPAMMSLVVLCLLCEKMMENEEKLWLMSVPCNNPCPGHSPRVDRRRVVALTRLSWRWLCGGCPLVVATLSETISNLRSQVVDSKNPTFCFLFFVKFSMASVGVRFVRLFYVSLIWGKIL